MSFADQWGAATVNDSDRTEPPEPGLYEVALDDARAFTAQSGNPWFVVELRVVTGDQTGHKWSILADLAKEGGIKAAKSMSAKLGVDVSEIASIEDLDRLAKVHVGSYYTVDVVQKGDFRNTYVRGPADGVSEPAGAAAQSAAQEPPPYTDEDIPFKWRSVEFEDRYHNWNAFA